MFRVLACALLVGCGFSGSSSTRPADASDDAVPDAPPPDAKTCSAVTYDLKFGGHSYRPTATATAYDGVVSDCHGDGGYVVAIDSVGEDAFVGAQFLSGGQFIWIGLHYDAAYHWDNQQALGSFNNFSGGSVPTSPADPCVDKALTTAGTWVPYTCAQMHQGMCECDVP